MVFLEQVNVFLDAMAWDLIFMAAFITFAETLINISFFFFIPPKEKDKIYEIDNYRAFYETQSRILKLKKIPIPWLKKDKSIHK